MQNNKEKVLYSEQLNQSEKLQLELDSRKERISSLSSDVDNLFQGENFSKLKGDIKESFNVPQVGEFHNEGIFMDTHLNGMIKVIDDIKNGNISGEIFDDVKNNIQKIILNNSDDIKKYVYLHDISKKDCLTIKYENGTKEEPTFEEYKNMILDDVKGNPVKFKKFTEEKGIIGISYFQKEKKNSHGAMGAEKLKEIKSNGEISDILINAINNHEVAYQFTDINLKTYEKYFGTFSDEEINWIISASYIDTMGSIKKNGKPYLGNFLNMVNSAENFKKISEVEKNLKENKNPEKNLDEKKISKEIQSLKKGKSVINLSADELLNKLKKDCKISKYNLANFEENLNSLVIMGKISEEMKDNLLSCINLDNTLDQGEINKLRKNLGRNNGLINEVLSECEM